MNKTIIKIKDSSNQYSIFFLYLDNITHILLINQYNKYYAKQRNSTVIFLFHINPQTILYSISISMENTHTDQQTPSTDNFNDWGRKTFDTCTKYIDSSKAVLDHYQSKKVWAGQEKHIHKINGWLEEDSQGPLVFKTEPGCGMKSILSQWQKGVRLNNQTKKQKILTIMHFASGGSNDSNYFYSLYQIITKLKEALKLKQNVDLLEENIRKFFAYWLDIVSSEVQRQQIIYCAQEIYHKVVIVIEAVDRFTDQQTGKEANIAFWLPQRFPKNVKVIVSARRHSQSILHLERTGCEVIDVRSDAGIAEAIHEDIKTWSSPLAEDVHQRYLLALDELIPVINKSNNVYSFLEFFSGVFLSKEVPPEWKQTLEKKVKPEKLGGITNIFGLYNFVIENSTQNSSLKTKFESALTFLAIAQKGLTTRQMLILTKLTQSQWCLFLGIFGSIIVCYEGVYSIKARWLIEGVIQREKGKKGDNFNEVVMGWHEKIARALQSTDNSIRKLEEQAYHLFCAKSYFRLKQMVSNIQNFLLLFNPHNKYELSRYWQKLQEKGFDPVIEYNKAVEGFSMHYHPSDENIFRIIVQISRFLKEFCDFETYDTPSFRHPFIQGNMIELRKIGLLTELSNLDIYVDNSFNPPQSSEPVQLTLVQQIQELKERYFPKDIEKTEDLVKGLEKATIEAQNVVAKPKRKNEFPKILSQIEQLNVDVPMNRNKFRQYYLKNIREFMKKEEDSNGTNKNEGGYLDVEQTVVPINNHPHPFNALSFQRIKDNYRLKEIKPSLYYYKRWIWIQFPWVCISLNNNYSTTPELRKKIEGDDIDSIQHEYRYTKQSLLVAIEARQKKRQMFTKKDHNVLENSKGFLKTKSNLFSITKYSQSKGFATQKAKALPQFDLSLQALSKELETRKKIKPQTVKERGQTKLLGEIKENCDQQMKFINLRKQFESPTIWGGEANQVLPRVKWAIKQHTNYELDYIKNHIEEKKKKLNKIIYENKRLGEVYQQLRIKQALTKKNLHEQEQQKCGKKSKVLDDLLKKKEDVITEFCKSLLQKERLKIILKLCSQNKTRNEEYLASLNYFLQNLKKMISFEKQNMKLISEQLESRKAFNEKQSALEQERSENRRVVEEQAQKYLQQKVKLEDQIENIKQTIWEDLQDQKDRIENSVSGHIKHRQEKNQIKQQEKTIKQLEERYEKASKDYLLLSELFDLKNGELETSEKMKRLLEENERNKHLKITYFEKKNRLQQLQRELQKAKQQNERQIQRELKKMSQSKNEKKQKQFKAVVGDHKLEILLDNICLKLGVRDKKDIVGVLKKKIQEREQVKCEQ